MEGVQIEVENLQSEIMIAINKYAATIDTKSVLFELPQ